MNYFTGSQKLSKIDQGAFEIGYAKSEPFDYYNFTRDSQNPVDMRSGSAYTARTCERKSDHKEHHNGKKGAQRTIRHRYGSVS
jgi:hypothetical protein